MLLTHIYNTTLVLLLTYPSESLVRLSELLSDLLRDPVWQFLGVVIGLIALYFTWLAFQRKRFSYETISNENILSIHRPFEQDIKITFRDKPINNLFLILIAFTNTGNVPITKEDYSENLEILLSQDVEILDRKLIDQYPSNLRVRFTEENETTFNPQVVSVKPLLLNPKDTFTIMILASGANDLERIKFRVDARIIGVKKIEENPVRFEFEFWFTLMFAGFLAVGFLFETFTVGGVLNTFLAITFTLSLIGLIRKKLTEFHNS